MQSTGFSKEMSIPFVTTEVVCGSLEADGTVRAFWTRSALSGVWGRRGVWPALCPCCALRAGGRAQAEP